MKISIRKSKNQDEPMTDWQLAFACKCVTQYKRAENVTYFTFEGTLHNEKIGCDVYTTKTQISAIVCKR